MKDTLEYNSKAWDAEVTKGNTWTKPVGPEAIAAARLGIPRIVLTPTIPVPSEWMMPLKGRRTLCLASGGGQQGPVLAAAGAVVTVLDASPKQLEGDRLVATRENLELETVLGDMRDLSRFADGTFDLIVHPCSNCFIPDVRPVWRECARVLKHGGSLLSGFYNSINYCFDRELYARGIYQLKYAIPYSDLTSISESERQAYIDKNEPLEFGHTLDDQIGGQIDAGFVIAGFYEDKWGDPDRKEDKFYPSFIATRAIRA